MHESSTPLGASNCLGPCCFLTGGDHALQTPRQKLEPLGIQHNLARTVFFSVTWLHAESMPYLSSTDAEIVGFDFARMCMSCRASRRVGKYKVRRVDTVSLNFGHQFANPFPP